MPYPGNFDDFERTQREYRRRVNDSLNAQERAARARRRHPLAYLRARARLSRWGRWWARRRGRR